MTLHRAFSQASSCKTALPQPAKATIQQSRVEPVTEKIASFEQGGMVLAEEEMEGLSSMTPHDRLTWKRWNGQRGHLKANNHTIQRILSCT